MNKMTVIGLVAAGIIIGAASSSYFSNKTSYQEQSPVPLDSNSLVIDNKKNYNTVHKSNPFDTRFTPATTVFENEENLSNADTRAPVANSEGASYTDFQTSGIERTESIINPNTTENTLTVTGSVGALTWEPPSTNDYENIQIQLSGPSNISIIKDFYNGEVASITEPLPDGYYNWQSVTTPTIDSYIKQQMAAVRESGDSVAEEELKKRYRNEGSLLTREQAKNNVQSGGFRVVNGEVLDGDIRE